MLYYLVFVCFVFVVGCMCFFCCFFAVVLAVVVVVFLCLLILFFVFLFVFLFGPANINRMKVV